MHTTNDTADQNVRLLETSLVSMLSQQQRYYQHTKKKMQGGRTRYVINAMAMTKSTAAAVHIQMPMRALCAVSCRSCKLWFFGRRRTITFASPHPVYTAGSISIRQHIKVDGSAYAPTLITANMKMMEASHVFFVRRRTLLMKKSCTAKMIIACSWSEWSVGL